ncbi:MAG: ArnT family glycosyltransferase [Chloroflexota bacterium]
MSTIILVYRRAGLRVNSGVATGALRLSHLGLALTGGGYLILAAALMYGLGYYEPDAMSRTSSTYVAVLGREPKLEALGFVWQPLPMWLQIPPLMLLRSFGLQAFAGPLTSVMATVATLLLLGKCCATWNLPAWLRRGLILLYALNPMVLLYAINGQTEATFMLCIIAGVYWFSRWAETSFVHHLALSGMAFSLAFLTRYEAIPIVAASVIGLLLVCRTTRSLPRGKLVSLMLVFILPPAYAMGVWMLLNWVIQGDPLFFLSGAYSNVAQTEHNRQPGSNLYYAYRSLGEAVGFVLTRAAFLAPAFAVLLAVGIPLALIRRSWTTVAIIGIWCSLPVFGAYLVYDGASAGELRYYMYVIPAGLFLARAVWQLSPPPVGTVLGMCTLAMMVLGIPTSLAALMNPEMGRMEYAIFAEVTGRPYDARLMSRFQDERAIAESLDARGVRTPVLLDAVTGFPILLNSQYPEQFVSTTDSDFKAIAERPTLGVKHILFHKPGDPSDSLSEVAYELLVERYPELLTNSATWATLEWRQGNWLMYRVLSDPPEPVAGQ